MDQDEAEKVDQDKIVQELQSEWGKTLKSDVVVEQLMNASYEARRDEILNGTLRIDQLIVKYPCLQSSFHVSDCLVFSNFALVHLSCK